MYPVDEIKERVDELKNKDYEVNINGLVVAPEIEQLIDSEGSELEVGDTTVSLSVSTVVDDWVVAYREPESGLGVPLPEQLRNMVGRVDVTAGGNIGHAHLDLFGALKRKFYDLDDELMDEEDVSFEGDRELDYSDEGSERVETLRFRARAEHDSDDFDEDEVVKEVREDLLGQAKEAVYSGEMSQDLKVNEKPPTDDEEELEEMDWRPDRIKIGDVIYEFNKIMLSPLEENKEEESEGGGVEVSIEDVGDDVKRHL